MGCANAKPQVHTKRPELNTNGNLNSTQVGRPVQSANVVNQQVTYANKENAVPARQEITSEVKTSNQKSNLSDIQRNPYLTREQQQKHINEPPTMSSAQKQTTNKFMPIQPIKQSTVNTNQPIRTTSTTTNQYRIPLAENGNNQPPIIKSPLPTQTNNTSPQQLTKQFHSDSNDTKEPSKLSTIKQSRQQSQITKKVQQSNLILPAKTKKDDIRIQNSIFSSATPRMDQNCFVSNISRPIVSPIKQQFENENSFKGSETKQLVESTPKKQQPQITVIQPNQFSNNNKRFGNEQSKSKTKDKSNSLIKNEHNQITTQEISVINAQNANKKYQQLESICGEFFIPMEENFDLSCSFSLNNLIVDMDKIAW